MNDGRQDYLVVVVPWCGGCPHRERAWAHLRGCYSWPVTIAQTPGSRMGDGSAEISGSGHAEDGASPSAWIKAAAVMPAVEASSAEIVIVADADCWTDGLAGAVEAVENGAPWAIPHRGVHRLTAQSTKRFIAGDPWHDLPLEQRAYLGTAGGGYIVAPTETLRAIGFDPRFVGWSGEDEAIALALTCLKGKPWRGKAPLIHLWHPPQERMSRRWGSFASRTLTRRYHAARNDPARMRALIEEARDDRRPDPSALHADQAGALRCG